MSIWESKWGRMRNFLLSPLRGLVVKAGWHVYSPGETVSLPERHQSQSATERWRMKLLASYSLPLLRIKRRKKVRKTALICPVFLSFSPPLCPSASFMLPLSWTFSLCVFIKHHWLWCYRIRSHCSNDVLFSPHIFNTAYAHFSPTSLEAWYDI